MGIAEGVDIINLLVHAFFLTANLIVIRIGNIFFIKRSKDVAFESHGWGGTWSYVTSQRVGYKVASRDGIDNKLRSGENIASDIDIGVGGLVGELIGDRIIAMPERDFASFKKLAPFNGLANGEDNLISLNRNGLAFIISGGEA